MVRSGRTTTTTNEIGNIQSVQTQHSAFETSNSNSMQMVGFASAMPIGTDVMKINIGGDNSNGTIIASNHQSYRPKTLASGETIIYDCAASQQFVYLKADGSIVINTSNIVIITAPASIQLQTPDVQVTGNLSVGTGATGTFGAASGETVTVQQGIITNID
jgi:phage gp45-like